MQLTVVLATVTVHYVAKVCCKILCVDYSIGEYQFAFAKNIR